ncbi:hypothetical protein DPMN_030844 [Dreissena polymorpha]|uniref:Uncharacterized protein n=1 Tax=Dreissena polymorpha TaxID=45954 RepID=A0A9D4M159_DREPO|nr:hypothetical protein DPMN_030844 [Dreissena polymorpha]
MIILCGFERRPHDVHGDFTATLPRPYYDYCVSTASLPCHLQNAVKTIDFGDHFKVVAVDSRPERFSATSLRSLGSLRRPSGVYVVLTATWVAVRTQ